MKPLRIIRHVPQEALGNLEKVLRERGLNLEIVDCFDPNWPQVVRSGFDPRSFSGLVVMGGPMNANETDAFPFLATDVEWLATAVRDQLPVLGVCLGAQLLAKALGARVYQNQVKEIGWQRIELLPSAFGDPLLQDSHAVETVFHWHTDTFEPPPGAVQLARSEHCEQQIFRVGPNAYGVQFHPEITLEMVADWCDDPELCGSLSESDGVDLQQIRAQAPEQIGRMTPFVTRLFERFAELCLRRG